YSPNLSAPTAFTGTVVSSGSILWSWSGGTGALSHRVLASTGGALSGSLGAAAAAFGSSGLTPNTPYGAFVRAEGCAHRGDSPVAVSTTLARPLAGLALAAVDVSSATFTWLEQGPAEAAGYRLEASTAADFSGTLRSSQTPVVALSTLTVFSLDVDATYYFRVGALNIAALPNFGASVSSVTRLSDPGAAAPDLPAASSLTVTAQWTAGTGPNPPSTLYTLRASTAADFTGTVLASATYGLSAAVSALTPDTTYYLEVRAVGYAGIPVLRALGSTPTWTADVGAPAASVVYASSMTAAWTPVAAQGYEFQACTLADFTGTLHSTVTPVGSLGSLAVLSPALSGNTTYYLRVGGINHSGVRNFVVAPATPTLAKAPTGSAVLDVFFTSATVQWTPPAPQPTGYRLEASTAADFSGTVASSATAAGSADRLTVVNLLSGTTYYLRAGGLNHASVAAFDAAVTTRTNTSPLVWTGAAGDHDWNNAQNWSPSGIPTRANSVTINVATAVVSNGLSVSFSSLTLGSPGGAAVSLTLLAGAGVQDGTHLLIHPNSGLTLETNQAVTLTGDLTMESGSTM
ncbi:hypothetical protein EPO15_06845, partial [bacterium]